ncbi:hypothetical protein F442_08834 [Phytophthora nicotianae P10297]|uniref:Uncharacterized protein n=2 Tax=Phytophthora nicotianae TaxID=4792 RepID=V9F5F3_PHYNI|nr:hypothetical protein F443_08892 [Phytophthora nicotianae P1569]ETP44601.1 hypothetical protein F442_08834 [Phytophthora nicotianae P10297]
MHETTAGDALTSTNRAYPHDGHVVPLLLGSLLTATLQHQTKSRTVQNATARVAGTKLRTVDAIAEESVRKSIISDVSVLARIEEDGFFFMGICFLQICQVMRCKVSAAETTESLHALAKMEKRRR